MHNDMEQRLSGEAESCAGGQISILGWDQKVHFCVHRSTCLSELNRVHTIHPADPLYNTSLPDDLFFSDFPIKTLCAVFFALPHAICPLCLILCDLITLMK